MVSSQDFGSAMCWTVQFFLLPQRWVNFMYQEWADIRWYGRPGNIMLLKDKFLLNITQLR